MKREQILETIKNNLKPKYETIWKVFKIWFSENIIKIEKESKNAK